MTLSLALSSKGSLEATEPTSSMRGRRAASRLSMLAPRSSSWGLISVISMTTTVSDRNLRFVMMPGRRCPRGRRENSGMLFMQDRNGNPCSQIRQDKIRYLAHFHLASRPRANRSILKGGKHLGPLSDRRRRASKFLKAGKKSLSLNPIPSARTKSNTRGFHHFTTGALNDFKLSRGLCISAV